MLSVILLFVAGGAGRRNGGKLLDELLAKVRHVAKRLAAVDVSRVVVELVPNRREAGPAVWRLRKPRTSSHLPVVLHAATKIGDPRLCVDSCHEIPLFVFGYEVLDDYESVRYYTAAVFPRQMSFRLMAYVAK